MSPKTLEQLLEEFLGGDVPLTEPWKHQPVDLVQLKMGGYKTKIKAKIQNEDPFKIVLKLLEKGSKIILD